ncbi:TetR/AcrR family transcriptional regulator [Paraliomyxa miuraensis]|uniref:TetR/AcrR family transcriptional regulator n=1 Tax=Paraliomyxa miuraensis TaxID=376150 RepID=UPI002259C250|nr:TetR/AcrR family transcriptional regulator [Paraliomyxa miuraensis]MCX4244351.1 TetR/AcrR family transcriptional regulator [Paraliomyxa miuraensis]
MAIEIGNDVRFATQAADLVWYGVSVVNGEPAEEGNRGEKPGAANHNSLKEAIVQAAIELGTELGEEGLTMRGIAARLGVSATALYQHFEGKASILRAIRFHGLALMNRSVAPAFDHTDPLDQIRESALAYINFARSNPWLYSLLFGGDLVDYDSLTDEEREVLLYPQVKVQSAFQVGKEQGKLRVDIDVATSPFLLWASNHGLAMLLITGRVSEQHPNFPVPSVEEFIRSFVQSEMRGLTPCES